jgi:hypothetical protein
METDVSGNRERAAYHEAGHCAAALAYAIPIIHVTIENDAGHLYRGNYRQRADLGLECMVTMCLAGPAAEALFCGPTDDRSGRTDHEMAKHYLSRRFGLLEIGAEIVRLREAAEGLVRTAWAKDRIHRIADALVRYRTLSGVEIESLG